MNSRAYRWLLHYGMAIASTAVALLLTQLLQPFVSLTVSPFFFVAITFTTWYGGLRPGVVAIILSTLAIRKYFELPVESLSSSSFSDLIRLVAFSLVALTIHGLKSDLQKSQRQVNQLNQKLLDESSDRLKVALNAAQMGMWDWDIVAQKITWSPEHERLFGLPSGSFDGRYETFDACLYPEDRAGLNEAIAYALKHRVPYHHEYRVVWADGSIHWVEGRGQALYNDDGQPVRMSGTIIAIDEHKQAQLLFNQQFEQQRLIAEVTNRVRQSLNLQEILQTTVDEVRRLLQVDRVMIFQFTSDWGGTIAVESVVDEAFALFPFDVRDPCIGDRYVEPFQQGLVTAKADIYTADISPCHVEFLAQFQVRANLVVPILKNGELWGLLVAHHCVAPRQWQDSEIDLLRQLATQVSIALQQAALFEQVQTELLERKQAESALQRFNAELEQRVAERTEELNALNNRLLMALKEQHQVKQDIEDLYNNAPCGYHSLDAEGTIVRINNTELNWLGYTRDEVLNKLKLTDIITSDSQKIFCENFPIFKQRGWINDLEFQLQRKDGSSCWVTINATAIKDDAGNFVMSRSSMFDISERKRSEAEREQAEQELALQAVITRNMAEGICLVKADDATIVYANPKFEQMFGYDPGELNGQNVAIVNYPNASGTPAAVYQSIRAAVLQNQEFSYEVHNVKKDGTPFWCRATCSVFKHSHYGDVLVAIQQDITQQKQSEAALLQQASLEKLRWEITQAIRQSLDLKVILDTTTEKMRQTLQVDRVAVYRFQPDWSGSFVAESVSDDWVKLVSSDIQRVWDDTYLQETQGGRFQNHETLVISDIYKAGLQTCHIELLEQFQAKAYAVAPIFSRESLWGLLAIYQNEAARTWKDWEIELLQEIAEQLAIALQQSSLYNQLQVELQERERTTAIIQESERRWRSLLDNVQLIVVELDHLGYINYINPFFLQLTGYLASEVLGKNWFTHFLSANHQQSVRTVFSKVLDYNTHSYGQNKILTKSGEERFIAWNNTRLQDIDGHVIGIISIGEDITERQKIDQMKQEFISVVSHELRTPLTSIRGSLGLIAGGVYDKKPEKMREMIAIAARQSDRLVRLVNDILNLRRLESGQFKFKFQQCSAADLIQQSVEVMHSQAEQHHVTLAIIPTTVEVWADPDAIVQTLTNLLSNAIKFSPPNSTVTVTANPYPFSSSPHPQTCFTVQDQGRGIPSNYLETIFGQFQQVDATDSREKGGTGLGLAICRTIVKQHDGRIWAESALEQGSTFYFTLPSVQPSADNG